MKWGARIKTFAKCLQNVLNNASLATWAQAALVAIGFFFTIQQIKDADRNSAINLSGQFVTKFIDLDLYPLVGQYRITQYNAVQAAKAAIPDYDAAKDPGYTKLFEVARPMIIDAIKDKDKEKATDNILKIEQFFEVVSRCVRLKACDDRTVSNGMQESMITFYNAVCPYTEGLEKNWKQSYFVHTLVYLYIDHNIRDPNRYFCRDFISRITELEAAAQ
jgi:hypothetical protein